LVRPTIYLDSSVISAYWYEGDNAAMLERRLHTREWWDMERQHFALWASALVQRELSTGAFPRQAQSIRMARRLPHLPATSAAERLADEIVQRGLVPANKTADAAHLATAATHNMDFLLTWNHAHMANRDVQQRFEELCARLKWRAPLMMSPESIPQVRFGESIRRK
jgi:hypothetical protein